MPKPTRKSTKKRTLIIAAIIITALLTAFILLHQSGALRGITGQSHTPTEPSDQPASPTEPAPQPPEEQYLVLEDWGVQFEIPEGLEPKYYKTYDERNNREIYEFTTRAIENLGGACIEPNNEGLHPPRIILLRETDAMQDRIPLRNSPIDGYYYYLTGSPYYCSDHGDRLQDADMKSLLSMLETISVAR